MTATDKPWNHPRPGLFELGRTTATPGALALLVAAGIDPSLVLAMHHGGQWGDLDDEDLRANEDALAHGDRILSVYPVGAGRVWVITEADRSCTTILLPSEY